MWHIWDPAYFSLSDAVCVALSPLRPCQVHKVDGRDFHWTHAVVVIRELIPCTEKTVFAALKKLAGFVSLLQALQGAMLGLTILRCKQK